MTENYTAKKPRYVAIAELAKQTGAKHGALYHFIRTHENQLHLAKIPTQGKRLFVREDDAQMICELFTNPDEYAEPLHQNGNEAP